MNNLKITILLPTYNGADRISRSIQSVQKQTFQDWELIIVIDGSDDLTFERVTRTAKQDSRIVVIQNKQNQGIQKTLNNGLAHAKGKYIARIDDDDTWIDPRKLQKQFDFLEKNTDHVLVGTGIVLVNTKGEEIGQYVFPHSDVIIRNRILGQNCFAHPAVMYRRDIVELVGGYSEQVKHKHIEDYELWLRMGTIGKFANLNEYAVVYQVSEHGLSGKNKGRQLYNRVKLCIEYKKDYPNFIVSLSKILFIFIGYITIGWMFARSVKVRSFMTALYKKMF